MTTEDKTPEADEAPKLTSAQIAEQRKAHVEGLKVERQLLSGRTDDTGKRRLGEVGKQLTEYGEKPAAAGRGKAAVETA